MKLLGIDHGTRRIGLAIGLTENRTAVPLRTIEGKSQETAAVTIAKIVTEEGIGTVVIGDPLMPSGDRGESSVRAHAFARELERHVGPMPIVFVDERMSSKLADQVMAVQGADRDSLAAAAILQSHLDMLGSR